jgi:hypothetical protein
MEFVKFPDIGQFRNTAHYVKWQTQFTGLDGNGEPVYDETRPLPMLVAKGTVKIHGTNAAICRAPQTGEFWLQSRNEILSEAGSGHYGFFSKYYRTELGFLFENIPNPDNEIIAVFGEWAGGNTQKGVAITGVPKSFFVFAVKVGNKWLEHSQYPLLYWPEHRIYDIRQFATYSVQIDFEAPELAIKRMEQFTLSVEKECPVARHFGVFGTGEGIVWRIVGLGEPSKFWFKTKGEEHKVTKTKELIPADIEKLESISAFIEATVTDARCQQAISILNQGGVPVDRKALGWFIKWVYEDIIKEESDTFEASGLQLKELGKPVADAARKWFFQNENSFELAS